MPSFAQLYSLQERKCQLTD